MTRIETEHFILAERIIDSSGDSTWLITEKRNNRIFYIHLFNNTCIYIKFFKDNCIKNPDEAITAFCNYISTKKKSNVTINIHYTNKALIRICTKAGFIKQKNVKHLYIFKFKG